MTDELQALSEQNKALARLLTECGRTKRRLRTQNRTLRRVIVLLCLLGLGLIAYWFLHNAFLSGATALAVGSSWGDFIA